MKTGIYKILNIQTQDFYIGSAVHFYNRKSKHIGTLRENKHRNKHLQNAFNKYGEKSFKVFLIEECTKENLQVREQYYIESLKPHYNIRTVVEGRWNFNHSEDTKERIKAGVSKFHFEKGHSAVTKQRIANSLLGLEQSDATIKKRSNTLSKMWADKGLKTTYSKYGIAQKRLVNRKIREDRDVRNQQIILLLKAKQLSQAEIATQFEVVASVITQIKKRYGLSV